MTLSSWVLRLAIRRLTAIVGKLTVALPSALLAQDQKEERPETEQARGLRIWIGFIVTAPLCLLIAAPVWTLQALLNLQVGLYDPNFWLPAILGAWAITLLSLVVQHMQIRSMERRIARLARTMDTDDPRKTAQQLQYWQAAMRTVPAWLERCTGIPVDRANFQGCPGPVA